MSDSRQNGVGIGGDSTRRQVLQAGVFVGATATLGGLLYGCGGGGGSSTTQGGTTTAAEAGTPGGILRIASRTASQPVIDGLAARTTPEIVRSHLVNDWPVNVDPEFKLVYPIAEPWETNAKGDRWTVRLKDGVEFHNGKTVSADDLIYTLKRLIDPKAFANSGPVFMKPLPEITRMRKLDPLTVQISLSGPNAVLDWLLGNGGNFPLVPVGFDPKKPVGCGPFEFVSFTPGDRAIFKRFENYHGQKAFYDEVHSIDIEDPTARLNALYAGQIDMVTEPGLDQAEAVKGQGQEFLAAQGGYQSYVAMKCDTGPLADPKVRLALKLSIDRDQVLQNAFNGFGEICNDVWGREDPDYDTSLVRERDVEQAKSLLSEAGMSDVSLELVIRQRDQNFGQVIQQNAAEAGINIELRVVASDAYYAPENYNEPPLVTDSVQGFSFLGYYPFFLAPGQFFNRMKWENAEFEKLREQAFGITDPEARKPVVQQMMKIFFEDGPMLIPVNNAQSTAYTPKIKGLVQSDKVGFGNGADVFQTQYFAK